MTFLFAAAVLTLPVLMQAAAPAAPAPAAAPATPAPATSAPAPPQPAGHLVTLAEAVHTALAKQPQLRQAQASTAAAFARADEGLAPLLPQISGTATYQVSTANSVQRPGSLPMGVSAAGTQRSTFDMFSYYNFGLTATQLIFDFGQTRGRYGANKSTAESQAETEKATRFQTIFNVQTAFFQARAQKALVVASRETLANQERHLKQVQGFVEIGTRPEIDLAQARTDLANARFALINAENNYATARAQLAAAMGSFSNSEFDVADDTLAALPEEDQGLEPLVQTALAARPELAALAKQIEANETLVSSAKGGYGPSLSASAAFLEQGTNLNNLGWNWNAGVTLTWPLFQGMLTPAQVRETKANLAASEAQRDNLELQLRLQVEQARLAVRGAKASLAAAEEVLANARVQLRLAEGRYQTGVGSIIELSDAQTAVITAEGQRVTADYNLSSARAQLMQAIGREML